MVTQKEVNKAAFKIGVVGLIAIAVSLSGCGGRSYRGQPKPNAPGTPGDPPPLLEPGEGEAPEDGYIVRARAFYDVYSSHEYSFYKFLMPTAYAATGATTVTYNNAAAVSFSINVSNFVAGGFSGDTLSLGSVSLASISDNNLKICGVSNNQKCNKAIIRVYTTGSISGFVNTNDTYGVPVYAGSLNPNTEVGLNAAGSVQVQTYTIPSNDNKVTLSDLPSPTYSVTSDFSNAGSGLYSMTFVVEYALSL
jgi:hypothetical protein